MKPSEVLDKAADEMLERGLSRGIYRNAAGEVCTLGAIGVASGSTVTAWNIFGDKTIGLYGRSVGWAREELFVSSQVPVASIPLWSDRVCRDKEEAALMLRAAAKRAEAAGE